MWEDKLGNKATTDALMKALVKMKETNIVEKIVTECRFLEDAIALM